MSAGLDSLGSVEFVNVLTQKLGVSMPGTLVFDYPSVSAVTGYLSAQMLKNMAASAPVESEQQRVMAAWELEVPPGFISSDLTISDDGIAKQQPVLIAGMPPRALIADSVVAGREHGAGVVFDKIQSVPLQRWDLDAAESLQRDTHTLSAQVRCSLYGDIVTKIPCTLSAAADELKNS